MEKIKINDVGHGLNVQINTNSSISYFDYANLENEEIDLLQRDIVISHLHLDHFSGLNKKKVENNRIYVTDKNQFSKVDKDSLNDKQLETLALLSIAVDLHQNLKTQI